MAVKVLLTGGAGYIGSITARAVETAGHIPVILDSLVTGRPEFVGNRIFYPGDIADRRLLRRIFAEHPDLEATVHLAARIVVPESVGHPYRYYRDNLTKSLELFDELAALGRPRVIFSSSASVYAQPANYEVTEESAVAPSSPYARTKLMTEMVLADLARATDLRAIILRYFNPIGSDPECRTGVHLARPSHVLGQLMLAVDGTQPAFTLTGVDYPTRDGTGLRDYIHVWDLARAHVRALERFDEVLAAEDAPSSTVNLGAGQGVTVRELVAAVEQISGTSLTVVEAPRRPGDSAGAFANVDKARDVLGWTAELTVADGIASSLAWLARRRSVLGF